MKLALTRSREVCVVSSTLEVCVKRLVQLQCLPKPPRQVEMSEPTRHFKMKVTQNREG